jgi:hypothetical protein
LTDEERVKIAKQEYKNLKVNQKIEVDGKKVGYVCDVINNKVTGEQSYIITDGNPKTQQPGEVQNVTVLYRGSTSPGEILNDPLDVVVDWGVNNAKILKEQLPSLGHTPTIQMQSSANTLNSAMNKYSNAQFEVYGHSQASTNGQYALSSLDSTDKINRIKGAYLYQGPNAYPMLSKQQKATAKSLKDKIFNFVDDKDIVPIGYWRKTVGNVIYVDSKKVGMTDQHMWGGYQFDNGNLKIKKKSEVSFIIAQNKQVMANELEYFKKLSKKLTLSGGGLSSNEKLYLDSEQARIIVEKALSDFQIATENLIKIHQDGIREAQELWQEALSEARSKGTLLNEGEIRSSLEIVGCTESKIVTQPCEKYQGKIDKITTMAENFSSLTSEIQAKINEVVQRDSELAQQLKEI